jgi:hypothetical protein
MRPFILVCVLLFTVAMLGVRAAAHEIVATFGVMGAVVTVGALYFGACYFERRP